MRTGRRLRFQPVWRLALVLVAVLGCAARPVRAGVPRFVAGQGWGVPPGTGVVWSTSNLLYWTDGGPLSPHVTKSQADAMVAAAAAVWNVPTSSISLAQGGTLAEDVSTANSYFDGEEMVFPADVQLANEGNIPVAILYDEDGSLTDMLLGWGASEPDACRQNAVVGDVDDIHQNDGGIHHATLILNGRCVGSTPQQLTQMQYQLARAFGRVLGLSWSQTNDNVFTAETTVTANQLAYWPLMHPMDVICGNYTYQCMSNPFTLRIDDLNTLAQLYPVYQGATPQGKQATSNDALYLWGILYFPTGQGMEWVNVTARRQNNGFMEDWQTASVMTGVDYTQAMATPVDSTPAAASGSSNPGLDGYFLFRRIPLNGGSNVFFTTEGVNPLYTGDYAIGPYVRPPVAPSGSPVTMVDWSAVSAGDRAVNGFMSANDAASSCDPGNDGTEGSPAALDASGWQSGLLCGWGHSSWWSVPVAAGHTWALEVTSTDETGEATLDKAQPVLGMWNGTDPTGTTPTVASEAVPFNSMVLGMTQMQMGAADADQSYRVSVSDQYGAGRPDFTYNARVLYVAGVTPATVSSAGGRVLITGTGFRPGNQVLVNGVPAVASSWTSNQIVAQMPSMAAAGAQVGVPLQVTVQDASTGGSASMPNAMSYAVQPNRLIEVSAPAALETDVPSATPFAVRVVASDGVTPVPGATVTLAVTAGGAQLAVCGAMTTCDVISDANGLVQTTVVGQAVGAVTLQATEHTGDATVQVTVMDSDPVRAVSLTNSGIYVAAGASGSWFVQLQATQDGAPASGVPVTWNLSSGVDALAQNNASGANGVATLSVGASQIQPGSVSTATGCAWSGVCSTWTLYGVDPSQLQVTPVGPDTGSVAASAPLGSVSFTVTDGAGHPVQGATVQVYQRVLGWEGNCTGDARCAAAPVLASSQITTISDASGVVTLAPLQVNGVPQTLEIAAVTGTQGFVTTTLTRTP